MRWNKEYSLSVQESYFMDLLRLLAAIWVMIMHAYAIWFPRNAMRAFHYGHAAVIIFFVLSGFVIAYTSYSKDRGPLQYAKARLSRLASILFPALVITALVEVFVKFESPEIYQYLHRGNPFPRYITSGLFLNEIWFFSTAPPINAPLWSLSFEFWYYVIFGIFFFKAKFKNFAGLATILFLIIGPKILLMMPIWLVGVFAFLLPKPGLAKSAKIALMTLTFFIGVITIIYLPSYPETLGTPPLFFAAGFFTDLIIGILFGIILWLFPTNVKSLSVSTTSYKYFRKAADLTFPIYVLHHPLLILYKTIFKFYSNNTTQLIMAILFALLISTLLGIYLEKSRPKWDNFFLQFLHRTKKLSFVRMFVSIKNYRQVSRSDINGLNNNVFR